MAVERLRGGARQEDVARELGVSRQRVGQWKRELEAEALAAGVSSPPPAPAPEKAAIPPGAPEADQGAGPQPGSPEAARAAAGLPPKGPLPGDSGTPPPSGGPPPGPDAQEIDAEQVVEDVTDIVSVILEAYAMFEELDADEALMQAIRFSGPEKRRLLTWAHHWVPTWKRLGATAFGQWIGLGMFVAMSSRKMKALSREVERRDAAKRATAKKIIDVPHEVR